MNPRPRAVTVISWIFLLLNCVIFVSGFWAKPEVAPAQGAAWYNEARWVTFLIFFIRFLGILGGAMMLLAYNWARWLVVVWVLFHLVVSWLNSAFQLAVHTVLFGVIVFFLFTPKASRYFRG